VIGTPSHEPDVPLHVPRSATMTVAVTPRRPVSTAVSINDCRAAEIDAGSGDSGNSGNPPRPYRVDGLRSASVVLLEVVPAVAAVVVVGADEVVLEGVSAKESARCPGGEGDEELHADAKRARSSAPVSGPVERMLELIFMFTSVPEMDQHVDAVRIDGPLVVNDRPAVVYVSSPTLRRGGCGRRARLRRCRGRHGL
jgi:hypothetical protein